MNLIAVWIGFVIVMGILDDLDKAHFLLFSGSMFYFVYIYNHIYPITISTRIVFLLSNASTLILIYILFIYNDFLAITPISFVTFMNLFLIYVSLNLYLLIYKSIFDK